VMRLSKNPVTSTIAWFYIWLFRGTPRPSVEKSSRSVILRYQMRVQAMLVKARKRSGSLLRPDAGCAGTVE
ncbi:hypothetical protein, partial [Streptomyces sp. BF23-30]|uniref:hypothetical protein n=1 Tax=Streptomyces sp. BF23-30 TaxID=3240281 RepID=UPI0034E5645B